MARSGCPLGDRKQDPAHFPCWPGAPRMAKGPRSLWGGHCVPLGWDRGHLGGALTATGRAFSGDPRDPLTSDPC